MINNTNSQEYGLNQNLAKHLSQYLQSDFSNFAFLITGAWGAGKTHFIKQFIENKSKEFKEKNNKAIFCYISLYGITKLEEIDQSILSQANPLFSDKSKKFGNITMSIVNSLSLVIPAGKQAFDIAKNIKEAINGIYDKIPDDLIIIIDDIERSSIAIKDILGYCNKLLNENNMKVIILSDEAKNSSSDEYLNNKEKVIGITMQVISDPNGLYETCLKKIKNKEISNILSKYQPNIINLYNTQDFTNLRSLNYFFYDTENLMSNLDKKILEHEQSCKEIILTLFIFSYLLKNNKIKIDNIYHSYTSSENENNPLFSFQKYFIEQGISVYAIDIPTWKEYFELESNYQSLNQAYLKIINSSPSMPLKLWRFSDKKTTEFWHLFNMLKNDLKNKKYVQYSDILHAYALFLYFSKSKIIPQEIETIVNNAINYINSSDINFNSKLQKRDFFESADGHGYYGEKSEHFKRVAECMHNKYLTYQKDIATEHTNKLKEKLEQGNYTEKDFYALSYVEQGLFLSLEPEYFVEQLINNEYYFLGHSILASNFVLDNNDECIAWFQSVVHHLSNSKTEDFFINFQIQRLSDYINSELNKDTNN